MSLSKLNLGMLTALTNEDKKAINEILAKMDSQKELNLEGLSSKNFGRYGYVWAIIMKRKEELERQLKS